MTAADAMDQVGHWTASVAGMSADVWIDRRAGQPDIAYRVSYRRPGRDHIRLRDGLTEAEAVATAALLRTALAAGWTPASTPIGDDG